MRPSDAFSIYFPLGFGVNEHDTAELRHVSGKYYFSELFSVNILSLRRHLYGFYEYFVKLKNQTICSGEPF